MSKLCAIPGCSCYAEGIKFECHFTSPFGHHDRETLEEWTLTFTMKPGEAVSVRIFSNAGLWRVVPENKDFATKEEAFRYAAPELIRKSKAFQSAKILSLEGEGL